MTLCLVNVHFTARGMHHLDASALIHKASPHILLRNHHHQTIIRLRGMYHYMWPPCQPMSPTQDC